jgi:nicotinate-nucleotide adenylyltransferase
LTVVVFGGSFNPPHLCHERVVRELIREKLADEVWLVPTHTHPFGKVMADFEFRLEMCRLAFAKFGNNVRVLEIERELEGVNYTVRTLETLVSRHGDIKFGFVVGSDVLGEHNKWKDFDQIEQLVSLVVVPREGFPSADPRVMKIESFSDVSSTQIRSRVRSGLGLGELVSPVVADFIDQNGLYRQTDQRQPSC